MNAAQDLGRTVGTKSACSALSVPRATFYRQTSNNGTPMEQVCSTAPPLALMPAEKQAVIDVLHSERFQDMAPHQIYTNLLDDGQYLCSVSTMYRFMREIHGDVKERRRQVQRPHYEKPELLATGPNQVYSWDITKLKTSQKWTYLYLYVIIDIFSRYVVGWLVAPHESSELAKQLIEETCIKQNIEPGTLTLHADRGSSMKSKAVAQLLADLGVTKTHSRPHVSNDNPYSESQFKTLKYCPQFPGRFGSIEDATAFCRFFFNWYNKHHHHSGIAMMTPENLHYGHAQTIQKQRQEVLFEAFQRFPKRFKGIVPQPTPLPDAVWINKPSASDAGVH